MARAKVSRLLRWCKDSALPSGVANLCSCRLLPYHACPSQHTLPPGLASMFNFSHAARVTPNRVCCNALLAAYARAKPPQYQRVSWPPWGRMRWSTGCVVASLASHPHAVPQGHANVPPSPVLLPMPPPPPQALHLLSAMWDGGPTLAPDAVSYNTALKACANAFQVRPEALLHPLGGHMKVADYACSIHC